MYKTSKRVVDLFLATAILLFLVPFLIIIAILVSCFIASPVFFKQKRTGLNFKNFSIYKLKSMTDARTPEGKLLPDKERLNRLGLFLRRWSLDELPQLFNVIRGDMSLVGPRPQLAEYTKFIKTEYKIRFSVKPGITGWAQVNGRNSISWEERFLLDKYYVENQSLWFDLFILIKTPYVLLKKKGILHSSDTHLPPKV